MTYAFEPNVLSRHMGDAFLALSPMVRDVHIGRKRLAGTVTVERGGWLARLICKVFRFPDAGVNVPLVVDCTHSDHRIDWRRRFGDHQMTSDFYADGDHLVERLGPLALYFEAVEDHGALIYCFGRARLLGIALPGVCRPIIHAREYECAGAYHFEVRVRMPFVGLVIAYGGQMWVSTSQ